LVDSDVSRFTKQSLVAWKGNAERAAQLQVETRVALPQQPIPSSHLTPVPNLAGMDYDDAREVLIATGWQPKLNHYSRGNDEAFQYGNGLHFWRKGYWEIQYASRCGLAHCAFVFEDIYRNRLVVITAGEIGEGKDFTAGVYRWYLDLKGEHA